MFRRLRDISMRSNIKRHSSNTTAINMKNVASMKKGKFWPFTRIEQAEKTIEAPDTKHWPKAVDLDSSGKVKEPVCGPTRKHLRERYEKPNWTSYTGYIPVDSGKLFYWYMPSLNNPRDDPFVLWLTGGPGCSSMMASVMEMGPCFVQR